MLDALNAWLAEANASGNRLRAVEAAARSVEADPWRVVREAGQLARCSMETAQRDIGLTETLSVVSTNHPNAVVRVDAGQAYPAFDRNGRKRRGAFDTPATMAHAAVTAALRASRRNAGQALDPSCGTGAFLVALSEQWSGDVIGIELDPVAAAVAAIAAPNARIIVDDGLASDVSCDVVVGNPPFIPPERQNKKTRTRLRQEMPWLVGRFDLAVPFAARSVERVRAGGGVGLILPEALMNQPYAQPLRERWLNRHAITHLTHAEPFPGAQVGVVIIGMEKDAGPAPLPNGLRPESLARLDAVPFHPSLRPGDPEIVAKVRANSNPLGEFATVDTGVVSHGSHGGKAVLLHATPTADRVPYVDAKDLVDNRTQWLDYRPETMHRPKDPSLFESPKVLVQRLRGRGPIRAWVDRSGLYAGHTLTVVRPDRSPLTPERIHALITHPLVDGLLRMERGSRLDLYPKDVRSIPVPTQWLEQPDTPLEVALGLEAAETERLLSFSLE